MKKKVIAILCTVLCVSMFSACGNIRGLDEDLLKEVIRNAASSAAKSESDEIIKSDEGKKEEVKNDEADKKQSKVSANVGEAFEADGLRITVEGVDFDYRTGDRFYDNIYDKGMRYIGVSFKVENISDEFKSAIWDNLDCYADNLKCETSISMAKGNVEGISGGRQAEFTLYWQAPVDAKSIELEYLYRDEHTKEKTVLIKLGNIKNSSNDEHSESDSGSDGRPESSKYIISDSNTRALTENDLTGFTAQELTYARNEIYARHGYSFKSSELREYFSKFDWYKENPSFNASDLSNVEMANANLIQNYQNKYGLEYSPN